jgi:hypothetical protein
LDAKRGKFKLEDRHTRTPNDPVLLDLYYNARHFANQDIQMEWELKK